MWTWTKRAVERLNAWLEARNTRTTRFGLFLFVLVLLAIVGARVYV
jgi:prolipoprotein diacylglyceryltransferase